MPIYIAAANGLASAATTFAVVTQVDVSYLNSEANNTVLTTAYVESAALTPGALTIDGIAVKVARRVASPAGTISVRLAQAGALVAGTEVTLNVSDIPYGVGLTVDTPSNGWIFFKFAAPVLLLGATAYTVSAKTSSASQVHLFRNATAGNWSRMVRTTTLAAIVAADEFHVLGEWTAAATSTTRTVTWDILLTTDFGSASTTIASVTVGVGGTLTWQATAATAYIMRVSGLLDVCTGGVFSMGITSTPCPRDSSMELQFDCGADGDFGLRVYGTWNGQGQSRLAASSEHFALLNTDEAAAQTILGTDRQLSAASGDSVALGSSTRTVTQSEVRIMASDATATTATVTAGLTNAHAGTAPTQSILFCVTRAVRVVSVSSTFMCYVQMNTGATVDCDWVGFQYVGGSAVAGKQGVVWQGASGSINFNKCAWRDCDTHCFYASVTGGVGDFTVQDCVFWRWAVVSAGVALNLVEATASTGWVIDGCVAIGNNTSSTGADINDLGGTFTDNWLSSCQNGLLLTEVTSNIVAKITGTFSGNTCQSFNSVGLTIQNCAGGTISNTTIWRALSSGILFSASAMQCDVVIATATIFGCGTNISLHAQVPNLTLRAVTAAGDTTFSSVAGLSCSFNLFAGIVRLEGCDFGTITGIFVAHTTTDISFPTSSVRPQLTLVDTILASATEITNTTSIVGRGFIAYQKHEGASLTNRKNYPTLGVVTYDSVTFRTASPSEKLESSAASANYKLESSPKRIPVASGQTVTVSVYVNKGATYNGNSPRLRVRHNDAMSIAEATVATHAAAAGAFSQLTGAVGPVSEDGVLEVFVDCDGSVGQINVDDYSYSVA